MWLWRIERIQKNDKKIKAIEDFKTEIKKETIKYKTYKFLDDLNFEKRIDIDETKKIEAQLEKIKIPKNVTNIIKISVITMNMMIFMIKS